VHFLYTMVHSLYILYSNAGRVQWVSLYFEMWIIGVTRGVKYKSRKTQPETLSLCLCMCFYMNICTSRLLTEGRQRWYKVSPSGNSLLFSVIYCQLICNLCILEACQIEEVISILYVLHNSPLWTFRREILKDKTYRGKTANQFRQTSVDRFFRTWIFFSRVKMRWSAK
jgi:hypothetical protein